MTNPKISVIVPVYNAEKYLHRCIDSILAQTFTDFELLLINDGSKDNSGKICDEYAAKDNRIRVFHKENGGVSSARNLGLDNAKGEWVTFVDSDDMIENTLWCDKYNSEVDLIITSFIDLRQGVNVVLDDIIFSNEEISGYLQANIGENVFRGPCAKLFKKNIIDKNSLRFCDIMRLGEDTLFVRQYVKSVNSLQLSKNILYVISEAFSLSEGVLPVNNAIFSIDALCNSLELIEKGKNIRMPDVKLNDVRLILIRVLKYIVIENQSIRKKKNELKKILENRNVRTLISDSSYIHKGPRRKIFDFLAQYKLYTLLALYIKIYQYD